MARIVKIDLNSKEVNAGLKPVAQLLFTLGETLVALPPDHQLLLIIDRTQEQWVLTGDDKGETAAQKLYQDSVMDGISEFYWIPSRLVP